MASSTRARLSLLLILVSFALIASSRSHPATRRRTQAIHSPAVAAPLRGFYDAALPRTPGSDGRPMVKNGGGKRPTATLSRRGRGKKGGGSFGFGERASSAMLPREFVPPSGSSACHNDMLDGDDVRLFACGAAAP